MLRQMQRVLYPAFVLSVAGSLWGACLVERDRTPQKAGVRLSDPRVVLQPGVVYSSAGAIGSVLQTAGASQEFPVTIEASAYSLEFARKSLIPSMGGSIAIGDYDGDGRNDLYVVMPGQPNRLFHGNADGTYSDVTAEAGVAGTGRDLSAVFSDYDHSGHPSLFVAGLGGMRLYRNNGNGTFTDRTHKAALDAKPGELYSRVLLADMDDDGFPDLVLAGYADLSKPPSMPRFSFPNDFRGIATRLYRNKRDGTFEEITAAAGLGGNPGRARSAIFADFNRDGLPDLLLMREEKPPALYINAGHGQFRDQTWTAGEPISRNAYVDAQVVDLDHDGWPDLVMWSTMGSRVLRNCQNSQFEQPDVRPLLRSPAAPFGFRGTVADVGGDGTGGLLAIDETGALRSFVNRKGRFEEMAFALSGMPSRDPAGGKNYRGVFDWMGEARVGSRKEPVLIALRHDGQVMLFERQSPARPAER